MSTVVVECRTAAQHKIARADKAEQQDNSRTTVLSFDCSTVAIHANTKQLVPSNACYLLTEQPLARLLPLSTVLSPSRHSFLFDVPQEVRPPTTVAPIRNASQRRASGWPETMASC